MEGVAHLDRKDFSPVIQKALQMDGFAEDAPEQTGAGAARFRGGRRSPHLLLRPALPFS